MASGTASRTAGTSTKRITWYSLNLPSMAQDQGVYTRRSKRLMENELHDVDVTTWKFPKSTGASAKQGDSQARCNGYWHLIHKYVLRSASCWIEARSSVEPLCLVTDTTPRAVFVMEQGGSNTGNSRDSYPSPPQSTWRSEHSSTTSSSTTMNFDLSLDAISQRWRYRNSIGLLPFRLVWILSHHLILSTRLLIREIWELDENRSLYSTYS